MSASVTLAEARRWVEKGIEQARRRNLKVSVAVVDVHGHLVQLDRMVGASPMSAGISEAKARTALNFQTATSKIGQSRPDDLARLQRVVSFAIIAEAGGVPIVRRDTVVGAIGVSGASPADDEALATDAIT
jgi:glc operon protein GlcG